MARCSTLVVELLLIGVLLLLCDALLLNSHFLFSRFLSPLARRVETIDRFGGVGFIGIAINDGLAEPIAQLDVMLRIHLYRE